MALGLPTDRCDPATEIWIDPLTPLGSSPWSGVFLSEFYCSEAIDDLLGIILRGVVLRWAPLTGDLGDLGNLTGLATVFLTVAYLDLVSKFVLLLNFRLASSSY